MGKHRDAGGQRSTSQTSRHPMFTGRHDAHTDETTVPVRVDTDRGRVTGWSVGREIGPGNYDRRTI